jgi:uncharacterized protein
VLDQTTAPSTASQGLQLPPPVGLVNDFAHVIPAEEADHIRRIAADVQAKSRGEFAIVTLPDLGGRDPADVGVQIIRQWKIGKAGNPGDPTRNAGAVILVVPKETSADGRGHCWVTTGQGTEGFITDATAGDMCRAAIPYFQQRDYAGGIELVTYQTAQRFANEFKFTLDTTLAVLPPTSMNTSVGISPAELFFLLLAVFIIFSALARRGGGPRGCLPIFIPYGGGWGGGGGGGFGGGGGWGGGGGGGGCGGFGGGGGPSGGGGGASW